MPIHGRVKAIELREIKSYGNEIRSKYKVKKHRKKIERVSSERRKKDVEELRTKTHHMIF